MHSDKVDNDRKTMIGKPMYKSKLSHDNNDLMYYSTYCPNYNGFIYLDDYIRKQFVLDFVREVGFEKNYLLD